MRILNYYELVNLVRKFLVSKISLQLPLSLTVAGHLKRHLLQEKLHLLLVGSDS